MEQALDEAQVEHDGAKALIIEIGPDRPTPIFQAKVKVLSEDIKHHVQEEEKPGTGIFAKPRRGIASRIGEAPWRNVNRNHEEAKGALGPPETRSFCVEPMRDETSINREQHGARIEFNTERERDECGRFASDDDDAIIAFVRPSRDDDDEDRAPCRGVMRKAVH